MRVLVSGWIGSTNLGDELVFAGMRRLLGDHRVAAISVDPQATRADHGVAAIDHRKPSQVAAATRSADLVVFGGGGLVQDETSPWNLPYHLSRPLLARLQGTPWVAIGIGVGRLGTALGRRLATTLRTAAAVTVRDEPSQRLLAELGVESRLSADVAFNLGRRTPRQPETDPEVEVEGPTDGSPGGHVVVSLRPWSGGTASASARWLPVGWRPGGDEPSWFVPTVAAALDRTSTRTGLEVRFVALQTDRDAELHERVAAAMHTPAATVVPTRSSVLGELGSGEAVVAMRYHAGIGATLAGRPSVLVGYSPKVDALAAGLGAGAAHLAFDREQLATIDDAVVAQLAAPDALGAVRTAADALLARTEVDRQVLHELIG